MKQPLQRIPLVLMLILAMVMVAHCAVAAQDEEKEKKTERPGRRAAAERTKGFPEELKLTTDQEKKLKKIRFGYEEKRHDFMLKMQNKKSELALLLNEEEPDRNRIEQKVKEILALEHKLQRLMLDEFFEVRKVLKPGQRKFFTRQLIRIIMK